MGKHFRGAFVQETFDATPLRLQLGEPERVCSGARNHDEVDARRQEPRPGSKALTAEPLDSVSIHRPADLACDDDAEPRGTARLGLRGDEQREVTRLQATAQPLRMRKLAVPAKPPIAPELTGKPAPTAPPLAVRQTDPPQPILDSNGLARDGIRTPWVDVPVARTSGVVADENIMSVIFGSGEPLDADTLQRLRAELARRLSVTKEDVPFVLPARAWAVRGTVPVKSG